MDFKITNFTKYSILSGILIGISAYLSVLIGNQYLSAFAFSFGLLFICLLHINLFTGTIGFINNKNDVIYALLILINNILGIYIISTILHLTSNANFVFEKCNTLSQIKLQENMFIHFFESLLCGMLMFLAVLSFDIYKHYICAVFPIFVFVVCGFEHCIANSFYYIFSYNFIKSLPYLIINILGNTAGSLFIRYFLINLKKEDKS